MGMFPEINRVWITIDSRLYLWNYESNQVNQSINAFEDQDQIIITVGLVKPVKGVFLEQIEYLLIVSTPLEILILGVAFNDKKGAVRGQMTIYNTEMSCASDNVNMTSIQGTQNGRVFMRGNNGQLYELVYQAHDGWFTRKIRKINHSSSGISLFVPQFLNFGSEQFITHFLVNDERNTIYAVTKDNNIEIYSLGQDGGKFERLEGVRNVLQDAVRLSESPQSPVEERNFQIVSIHCVLQSECRHLDLVAITSTGHRLYFSHSDYDRFQQVQTRRLKLVFVRHPPQMSSGLQYGGQLAKIHQAHYANGITIASQAFTDEIDRVLCFSLDTGLISQAPQKYLAEIMSSIDIDGKTWAIVEAHTPHWKQLKNDKIPGAYLNELVTQFEYSPRKFYLLTNNGLTGIVKLRPVDVLVTMIMQQQTMDLRPFKPFFDTFGSDQACAMSLAVACGHQLISQNVYGLQSNVVTLATRLYLEMGGVPTVNDTQQQNGGPLGVPLSTQDTKYSSKHNGMALYFARLLRPVWKKEILVKSEKNQSLSVDDLIQVQKSLENLDKFLKSLGHQFTAAPTPGDRPNTVDPDAWRAEQQSIANMFELLQQTIESLAFISIILDYQLPQLAQKLAPKDQEELRGLTFEAFVTTPRGKEVGKALMAALVNLQIERGLGVETVVSTLQDRCSTICEANDVILFKGIELVQSARANANIGQQNKLLAESVGLFTSVLKSVSFEKLRDIVESFKSLKYYTGIVDLVLTYATYLDPVENVQLDVTTHQSYFKKYECYVLIFNTLGSFEEHNLNDREAMIQRCLASKDYQFHTYLYDWFIKQQLVDHLLRIKSPYLEQYLLSEKQDRQKADLLWKYYVQNNKHVQAAIVMSEIGQLPQLLLSERIEYFTKAISNCKSGDGAQTLLVELNDLLDVCKIQMEIYQQLQARQLDPSQLQQLEYTFFDMNQLFMDWAWPYKLYEIILWILHVAEDAKAAGQYAEYCWTEMIRTSISINTQSPFEALGSKIIYNGRKFYPDDKVFPLLVLVSKLEQVGLQRSGDNVDPRWLVHSLEQAGVPTSVIFSVYHSIFESKLTPWSTPAAIKHLIRAIVHLLDKWTQNVHDLR
ncbi:Non-repetitive/WGA-negative nucleoporin C-terminal-domain-containing protein [Gorgonomyces haynaldii]|nr:Non-repetitive/WGA-negative nucleoporin C-terminal-domain-containing protein [Gorgonomyces haynaldii]